MWKKIVFTLSKYDECEKVKNEKMYFRFQPLECAKVHFYFSTFDSEKMKERNDFYTLRKVSNEQSGR